MHESRIIQLVKKHKYESLDVESEIFKMLTNSLKKDISLTNPMLIKLSINDEMYNKYLKDILKLSREEYLKEITTIMQDDKKVKKYLLKYIDEVDLENEFEHKLCTRLFNTLKEELNLSKLEFRFVVKYLIKRKNLKHNIDLKVYSVNYKEYMKLTKKKSNPTLLEKKSNLYFSASCENNGCDKCYMFFNYKAYTDFYLKNGAEPAFLNLIHDCYHEFKHAVEQNNQKNRLTINNYRMFKERILVKYDYQFYLDNHYFIETEIDADTFGYNEVKSEIPDFLDNFKGYKTSIASNKGKRSIARTGFQYDFIEDRIDEIILEHHDDIEYVEPLRYEYNFYGRKHDLMYLLAKREFNVNEMKKILTHIRKSIDIEKTPILHLNETRDLIEKLEIELLDLYNLFDYLICKAALRDKKMVEYASDNDKQTIELALINEIKKIEENIELIETHCTDPKLSEINIQYQNSKRDKILVLLTEIENKKRK